MFWPCLPPTYADCEPPHSIPRKTLCDPSPLLSLAESFPLRLCRRFQVRPDPIYRMVLKFLRRDARVTAALGKPLSPGKFRAYRYETRFPTAKLQLMFELIGKDGHAGSCQVEVSRTWRGAYDFGLLAVDVAGTGERILLSGDGARQLSGNVNGLN